VVARQSRGRGLVDFDDDGDVFEHVLLEEPRAAHLRRRHAVDRVRRGREFARLRRHHPLELRLVRDDRPERRGDEAEAGHTEGRAQQTPAPPTHAHTMIMTNCAFCAKQLAYDAPRRVAASVR